MKKYICKYCFSEFDNSINKICPYCLKESITSLKEKILVDDNLKKLMISFYSKQLFPKRNYIIRAFLLILLSLSISILITIIVFRYLK